jgi:hypothetical protein
VGLEEVIREPRVISKRDRCIVDNKPRPLTAVAASDPFCRTECCKEFHGVDDPVGRRYRNARRRKR